MGKPRSAIAVRGSTKALLDEALKAFSKTLSERRDAKDFDEVIDFTREHCEELGGPEGEDCWHLWQHGEFAILGDLSLLSPKDQEALKSLSQHTDELSVGMLDASFGDILAAVYRDGDLKRLLSMEDGELYESGSLSWKNEVTSTKNLTMKCSTSLDSPQVAYLRTRPALGPFELVVIQNA